MLGKGTPLIYINGRQVRDDSELDQLNSEDIKSVEVVTNPGARYDATVTAVIRIQTIRRAGDGFGFDLRSSYYQSRNVDLIEQLNVNYRHNGLDIFGIFRYLKNEYIMKNDIVHTLESDSLWKYQNLLDGTVVDKSLRGEIGANYSLNDKHSLGFRLLLLPVQIRSRMYLPLMILQPTISFMTTWKIKSILLLPVSLLIN